MKAGTEVVVRIQNHNGSRISQSSSPYERGIVKAVAQAARSSATGYDDDGNSTGSSLPFIFEVELNGGRKGDTVWVSDSQVYAILPEEAA